MLIEDSNAGQSHPVATPVRKRREPAQSVECLDSQPEKKMQRPSPMEDASSNDGTPSPQLEVATADAKKPEKQPTEAQPTPRVEIRFGGMTHRQAWFSNSVHM